MLKKNEFSDHKGVVWETINSSVMESTGEEIYLAKEVGGRRYQVSFDIESFDYPCVTLEYFDGTLAETVFHAIRNSLKVKS